MSNSVTVTQSYGAAAEGTFLFAAVGTLMDSSDLAIVTPVVQDVLDLNGNLSATLLASDNYAPGSLNWSCFVSVRGVSQIHVIGFPVDYALGASQNLYQILAAVGWTPPAVF